jgi:hypothetical protein
MRLVPYPRARAFGRLLLLVLLSTLAVAALALAKGPPDKATISGPGLKGEVEITDPGSLAYLGLGALGDFGLGALPNTGGATWSASWLIALGGILALAGAARRLRLIRTDRS